MENKREKGSRGGERVWRTSSGGRWRPAITLWSPDSEGIFNIGHHAPARGAPGGFPVMLLILSPLVSRRFIIANLSLHRSLSRMALSLSLSLSLSLFLFLYRSIGSQRSVYVRSYEIPRRFVSAVIEYFYTAEFNSGPRGLNGEASGRASRWFLADEKFAKPS